MRLLTWFLWGALAVPLLAAGCEQEIVLEFKTLQTALGAGQERPADHFWGEITFCERVSKKTGKRIRSGERFSVAEKSYVHGLVDLTHLPPDRNHSVHLVWLTPDGHELYRRYAELRMSRTDDGYRTQVVWLDAEDFSYRKLEVQETETPTCTLGSRLNTSLSRQRPLGRYLLRVYLNREFLLERGFDLTAM